MEYIEIMAEIDASNISVWQTLNFDALTELRLPDVLERILHVHVGVKYYGHFASDAEKSVYRRETPLLLQYFYRDAESLTVDKLEQFYFAIYTPFGEKLLLRGAYYENVRSRDIVTGKPLFYINSQFVRQEMEDACKRYDDVTISIIQRIYRLCFHDMLNMIHPFTDNNFGFASLLCDVLLLKHHYLPVAIKPTAKKSFVQIPREMNFGYLVFLHILRQRYARYTY